MKSFIEKNETRFSIVAVLMIVVLFSSLPSFGESAKSRQLPKGPIHDPQVTPDVKLNEYWENAKKEVYKSVDELLAQRRVQLARGIKRDLFIRGDTKKKRIALTFDDGPHPAYTPQLLAILKRYDVKATFFLVGERAEEAPDLVRAEVAAGHDVGNHTYHHVNLTKVPESDAAIEIKACGEAIRGITGTAPHLFRPPGGDYDDNVAEAAEELGYSIILWTDDPGDYASPGAKLIENRILKQADDGGIILIHDGIQQTISILPDLIEKLRKRGFEFATIDELMKRDRRESISRKDGD